MDVVSVLALSTLQAWQVQPDAIPGNMLRRGRRFAQAHRRYGAGDSHSGVADVDVRDQLHLGFACAPGDGVSSCGSEGLLGQRECGSPTHDIDSRVDSSIAPDRYHATGEEHHSNSRVSQAQDRGCLTIIYEDHVNAVRLQPASCAGVS